MGERGGGVSVGAPGGFPLGDCLLQHGLHFLLAAGLEQEADHAQLNGLLGIGKAGVRRQNQAAHVRMQLLDPPNQL